MGYPTGILAPSDNRKADDPTDQEKLVHAVANAEEFSIPIPHILTHTQPMAMFLPGLRTAMTACTLQLRLASTPMGLRARCGVVTELILASTPRGAGL
jgi:hypothetical protein